MGREACRHIYYTRISERLELLANPPDRLSVVPVPVFLTQVSLYGQKEKFVHVIKSFGIHTTRFLADTRV